MTTKRKVKKCTECEKGNHQFIISNWVVSQTMQKANSYTCQRCLLTVEGNHDVKLLREQIHVERELEA